MHLIHKPSTMLCQLALYYVCPGHMLVHCLVLLCWHAAATTGLGLPWLRRCCLPVCPTGVRPRCFDERTAGGQQGVGKPEDAEAFKARIQQLIDRYEAQHLPRKQRKVTQDQIREIDEGELPNLAEQCIEGPLAVCSSSVAYRLDAHTLGFV